MNNRTPSHPAPPGGACQDSAPPILDHTGHTLPDHFRSRMRFCSGEVALVEVRVHPLVIVPTGGTTISVAEVAHV